MEIINDKSYLLAEIQRLRQGEPPSRPSLIFVNRAQEMRVLLDDAERVMKTKTGVARVIIGDAGMGKSTLIYMLKELLFERKERVAFSYVELRGMADVRPSELGAKLYAAILENLEDKEGLSGRELLTRVASRIIDKLAGFRDRLVLRLVGRVTRRLRERVAQLGGYRHALYALLLLAFDDLNPIAYDYLLGLRGLEPVESHAIVERLGERIPWKLEEEKFSESLLAVVRALDLAGYELTVIAIDELEMLYSWRRDWVDRFLPKLTALLSVRLESGSPCYFLLTTTPAFWESDENKSIRVRYPFLYQRLRTTAIGPLSALTREDAEHLASRLTNMYRRVYGDAALMGVDERTLAMRAYSAGGGAPRELVTHIIDELEARVLR